MSFKYGHELDKYAQRLINQYPIPQKQLGSFQFYNETH